MDMTRTTGLLVVVCLGLGMASPVRAENAAEPVQAATLAEPDWRVGNPVADQLGGGADAGRWSVAVSGGWAWSALRGQYGFGSRLAALAQVETALGFRFQPAGGLGVRLLSHKHARIAAEGLFGWLFQLGELEKRGPTLEARVRFAFPAGRVVPYVLLGTRHAILSDRTSIERASGSTSKYTVRHEWTPWLGAGLGAVITKNVGLELGLDYGWVDAPETVVIPGFHLAVLVGGGR